MSSDGLGITGKMLSQKRISIIVERIQNGEELSISVLAKEFDVATKSLQRDFKNIMQMFDGLIERTEDGKKFRKKAVKYAASDNDVLIEMLDSMSKDIGTDFYAKAHPLLKRLKNQIERPFYTRMDVEDITMKLDIVQRVEEAISIKKLISFEYARPGLESKHFEKVGVFKIIVFNGFWYVLAEHKGHFKKFYLKEIQNIVLLDTIFTPSKDIAESLENSVSIWFNPKVKPYEVILEVDERATIYLERKKIYPNQKLYKRDDGTSEVVIKITHEEELFPILKYWIPHIRVQHPSDLQEKFESIIRTYLG